MKNFLLKIFFIILTIAINYSSIFSQNITDSKGLKQGVWKKVDEQGNIKFEGKFVDNIPVGLFTYYHANKQVKAKSIFYENGKKAQTSLYNLDGKIEAIGAYYEQKRDSCWTFYDVDGNIVSIETYKKGKKNGRFATFQKGGKITEEEYFIEDVKHGPWRTFNEDGNLSMLCFYKNGEPDSIYSVFYPNKSKKVEGNYKDAQPTGSWLFYNEDGSLKLQEIYKNGKITKTTRFNGKFSSNYTDNIPQEEFTYKNGKKNGPFVEYYDIGKFVKKFKPMKDDEAQEAYEVLEGQIIKRKGEFKDDKLFGKITYYDEKGKVQKVEEYDANGNLVKK